MEAYSLPELLTVKITRFTSVFTAKPFPRRAANETMDGEDGRTLMLLCYCARGAVLVFSREDLVLGVIQGESAVTDTYR
jgi:hypothetical protein